MFRLHRIAAALAALLVVSPAALNAASPTASNQQYQARYRGTQEGMPQPHAASKRKSSAPRVAVNPATVPPGYPRYRLIDLGTLGGPESNVIFPGRTLNNRGTVLANSDTPVPDPNCSLSCYWGHAFLRRPNGQIVELPFPAGIDPTVNESYAGDITANGQLGGFVTNGLMDPLTGFPQLRPAVWGVFGGGTGPGDLRRELRAGDDARPLGQCSGSGTQRST